MTNFSTNGNAPQDAKNLTHDAFGNVWAKVIARVWLYKSETQSRIRSKLIEKGQAVPTPTADDVWYAKLMSNDTNLVKEAMLEEGLVSLTSMSADSNDWQRWITSNIYILMSGTTRTITVPAGSDAEGFYSRPEDSADNGWQAVTGIDQTVVLTLPEPPDDPSEFAVALADYCCTGKTYVFSC